MAQGLMPPNFSGSGRRSGDSYSSIYGNDSRYSSMVRVNLLDWPVFRKISRLSSKMVYNKIL